MHQESHLEDLTFKIVQACENNRRHEVSELCESLAAHLHRKPEDVPYVNAERLLCTLRNDRHFDEVRRLSDRLISAGRRERSIRRHLGQALIDGGAPSTAIAVLRPLLRTSHRDDDETAEAHGLTGRAYKQIFIDNGKANTSVNRKALAKAAQCYAKGFSINRPRNYWHGINLVAMHELGGDRAQVKMVAEEIMSYLDSIPADKRDAWVWATGAEARIALADWAGAEAWLSNYLKSDGANAFAIAGTLRQFIEVWNLDKYEPHGQELIGVLRSRQLREHQGHLHLSPNDLRDTVALKKSAFERILGDVGTQSYRWLQRGLAAACSVARIREGFERGIGTGFVVRGGDFRESFGNELLLLTNAHVVSEDRGDGGLLPEDSTVAFQVGAKGEGGGSEHQVEVVWSSPRNRLDATLLRLDPPIFDRVALSIAKNLPTVQSDEKQRVYVIGHPGGRDLSFSLQDNSLLDHEGPKPDEAVGAEPRRLHYRAPTEGGSSGSPVFDQKSWRVIGLHHAGGEFMPRLHGKNGTYPANEAIWIQSVIAGARAGE